jgi:hypothetical protein
MANAKVLLPADGTRGLMRSAAPRSCGSLHGVRQRSPAIAEAASSVRFGVRWGTARAMSRENVEIVREYFEIVNDFGRAMRYPAPAGPWFDIGARREESRYLAMGAFPVGPAGRRPERGNLS